MILSSWPHSGQRMIRGASSGGVKAERSYPQCPHSPRRCRFIRFHRRSERHRRPATISTDGVTEIVRSSESPHHPGYTGVRKRLLSHHTQVIAGKIQPRTITRRIQRPEESVTCSISRLRSVISTSSALGGKHVKSDGQAVPSFQVSTLDLRSESNVLWRSTEV